MANRLLSQQSLYLQQHAHNPVDWYPWGDEAFDKAKEDNKPVLVSIGYAACHWCHVMERESFEDTQIAAFMNQNFVCIKVDREEHPDVDNLYMDAVTAISGSGGWPLNVFVTPDRLPFYGGTYFPPRAAYNRPSWHQLLNQMVEIWYEQRGEVDRQAAQMLQHLRQAAQHAFAGKAEECTMADCRTIAEDLLKRADKEKGGFGNAPKFPGTMAISFLLEHYWFTKYEPALHHALHSLDAMADGGIYDQLGGGFARYSTDRDWLAPHFEKMLYDNALLITTYCDAYSITNNDRYKTIIEETIAFAERELKDPTGGYYCAIDADSEGVEGKFYTWLWEDFTAVLKDDYKIPAQYFGVVENGNWEKTNILHVATSIKQIADEHNLPQATIVDSIAKAKQLLLGTRAGRIRPVTDDKSLLSWNALMNISLTKAGVTLNNEAYLTRAAEHINWMLTQFWKDDSLHHVWKNGTTRIAANLEDYAYLIQALLQLGAAVGDNSLIIRANELIATVNKNFISEDNIFFYFTAQLQKDIPVRKVEVYDGATPAGNAIMVNNLLLCGLCTENGEWIEQAGKMLEKMKATTAKYSYSFGYWAMIMQRKSRGIKTVVCAGNEAGNFRAELSRKYLPQAYIVTSEKEISELPILKNKNFAKKTPIFVCSLQECLPAVSSVEQAIQLIEH